MWRRALLAAAAVSCTLPPHARAHREPRFTQIQDLICVLIMSGMQKEDLDVSMLGKLRRYNVNLDDINNERIRQQCASRRKDDQNEMKEVFVSTTEYNPTISTKNQFVPDNLNMDSFMEYLKTRKDSNRNVNEITTEKITSTHKEMVTNVTAFTENKPNVDMDLLRRLLEIETQNKSFYKIDDDSETAKHASTINIKTDQRNSVSTDDNTIIDKLIKDYLLKKQKMLTTTEHTTTTGFTIDIQNIYKRIDEIFANRSYVDSEKAKTEASYQKNNVQSNVKHDIISPDQVPIANQNGPYPTGKQLFDNFYNFLSEMNQSKINSSHPSISYDNNVHSKDTPQINKVFENINRTNQDNTEESTTHKSKFEKELDERSLTPSLVKEIAETVKDVIIKDLRNEFAGIYSKTTMKTSPITFTTLTTTKETIPTTTLKTRILDKDTAILEKVMDLYEEIKSLKQTTYSLKVSNASTTFVNNLKIPNNAPRNSPMIMPMINRLPIQEPKVLIPSVDYNAKPLLNYNAYLPRKEINRLPITIQTNSVEIQPLVVAVSKPESMVRQNIIVHTGNRHPLRVGNNNHLKYLNPRARYTNSDVPLNHMNKTYNNYNPYTRNDEYNSARISHNLQEQKQRDDVIRFRLRDMGNSKLATDYYEKINFGNKNNGYENRGIYNNHNYPRFHERLERVNAGSDGTPVVSDVDIKDKNMQNSDFPSRHQLSLVDMKKGTPYDDTHFKNFIKTQQKVTDMLERILATRPKTNTPRSVETV